MKPRTRTNSITWERPLLYPKQEKSLFHDERYGVIEASTKSGKTHAALVWIAEQAWLHGRAGKHYW